MSVQFSTSRAVNCCFAHSLTLGYLCDRAQRVVQNRTDESAKRDYCQRVSSSILSAASKGRRFLAKSDMFSIR